MFVTTVADNVLKFANGVQPQALVGLAIVLALVVLLASTGFIALGTLFVVVLVRAGATYALGRGPQREGGGGPFTLQTTSGG